MYIVILVSLLALYLTYLDANKNVHRGMMWGFFFLTILGCIHYDYGNDYLAYLNIFKDITKYPFDLKAVLSGDVYKEPGWALLCYAFNCLGGFFMMVATLNIIENILIYKAIKRYVDKRWWPMSMFFYICSTSLYLMSFSMMRQYLVISIFLGIWPLIEQRKCWKVVGILLLCFTIHTSALILLPVAFLGYLPIRRNKLLAVIIVLFYFAIWFRGSFINDVFASFMVVEQFEDYADTYGSFDQKVTYGIGFFLNQIPFILSIFYLLDNSEKKSQSDKAIIIISIMGFIIIPFATIVPNIGRIGMYFVVYQMLAIPKIYSNLKNVLLRYATMFVFIFMTLYDYYNFFYSPIWFDKYTTFKTIFPEI